MHSKLLLYTVLLVAPIFATEHKEPVRPNSAHAGHHRRQRSNMLDAAQLQQLALRQTGNGMTPNSFAWQAAKALRYSILTKKPAQQGTQQQLKSLKAKIAAREDVKASMSKIPDVLKSFEQLEFEKIPNGLKTLDSMLVEIQAADAAAHHATLEALQALYRKTPKKANRSPDAYPA